MYPNGCDETKRKQETKMLLYSVNGVRISISVDDEGEFLRTASTFDDAIVLLAYIGYIGA